MKKFCLIVLFSIWFCKVNAITVDSFSKQYLEGRKLEEIEGVWRYDPGSRIIGIYKQSGSYKSIVIQSTQVPIGSSSFNYLTKGSSVYFYGTSNCSFEWDSGWSKKTIQDTCTESLTIVNTNVIKITSANQHEKVVGWPGSTRTMNLIRIWPENFSAHNSKYGGNSKTASKKINPSSGTAFFVTDKGHLITNHHVVDGCEDKSKIVYKDKEYPAKLIAKDKLLDFALLKADISRNKFIVLSDEPPKKLQRIIAAGYPLGKNLSDDLKFTSGIISSLKGMDDDSTLIQIDAALNPGNSGGPIVDDKTGELVAVAVAGMRKDKTEAINFGIKTNSLKNFLDSNQIRTSGSKMLFSFGNADVSNILEESTVYTFCK